MQKRVRHIKDNHNRGVYRSDTATRERNRLNEVGYASREQARLERVGHGFDRYIADAVSGNICIISAIDIFSYIYNQ